MSARIDAATQLSLLDWVPPSPTVAFERDLVRGNTFERRLSRVISVCLETCGRSREQVADAMSRRLDRHISVNILNAYSSPERETHVISVPRYEALLAATQDQRLLEFIAEPHGLAVVDRRLLPMIQLAEVQIRKREISRMEAGLRREARWGTAR